MQEEMNREEQIPPTEDGNNAEKALVLKKMKRCFNSCGWALFALIFGWFGAIIITQAIFIYLEQSNIVSYELYNKYYMIFNELTLAFGMAIAWLIIRRTPKKDFAKQKISLNTFMILFSFCMAIGYIGNLISSQFISVWNFVTGNEVVNSVSELISSSDIWVTFLFVGIIGPILEELFFRKLLIDRMRPYGEVPAILISAAFFGMFHMNFSQFLYAFGIGLVLGFLYYRTGNFVITTALHALFNIVMSAIQMLFYAPLMEFLTKLEAMGIEEDIFPLLQEYAIPLLLYALYSLAIFGLVIAGIVLFCMNVKKIKLRKNEHSLEFSDYKNVLLKSPGVIAAVVLLMVLMITSLF